MPNTRALYSVRLWGPLDQLWADRFSLGLSALGLSILNGFARQDRIGPLGAEFLIAPSGKGRIPPRSTTSPSPAARRRIGTATPCCWTTTPWDGSPEHGPVMYLAVRGPDRVGFLGSLVRALVSHPLVPQEMTISTCNGVAFDRFLLQTAGGRVPSEETRRALALTLDGTLRRRGRVGLVAAAPA